MHGSTGREGLWCMGMHLGVELDGWCMGEGTGRAQAAGDRVGGQMRAQGCRAGCVCRAGVCAVHAVGVEKGCIRDPLL